MNKTPYPIARKTGLVVQQMPDEVLVYDLDTNKAHCLNSSAAFVWKHCDGQNSVSDIVRRFETDTEKSVTDDFVWLAIDQLSENRLLETEIRSGFYGQSRREVIKKLGLAAVIGLPIIASLVAPPNALAVGSCVCMVNVDCTNQTNCASTTNCNTGICAP